MAFNPKDYMLNLKGKQYLPVPARILWFREAHPTGGIVTDTQVIGEVMVVRAVVTDANNILLATGMATVRAGQGTSWQGREIEKGETAAIGRALGHAGFGTLFTEDDEGDYLADSPQAPKKAAPRQSSEPSTDNGRNEGAETLQEVIIEFVETRKDSKGKPYYAFRTVERALTVWSLSQFEEQGWDAKSWQPGAALDVPVTIERQKNGYWKIIQIDRSSEEIPF